jgi:hypothetical protein
MVRKILFFTSPDLETVEELVRKIPLFTLPDQRRFGKKDSSFHFTRPGMIEALTRKILIFTYQAWDDRGGVKKDSSFYSPGLRWWRRWQERFFFSLTRAETLESMLRKILLFTHQA